MRVLRKMEEWVVEEHVALHWSDECYYLLEFHPGKRYGFHPDNDLIKNFKRHLGRGGELAHRRKEWAIRDIAHLLRPALAASVDFSDTTFVPIPPSKTRSSPLYDDRVSQLLRLACPPEADIRELIVCRADATPAHYSAARPSVEKLLQNYTLAPAADGIVLPAEVVAPAAEVIAPAAVGIAPAAFGIMLPTEAVAPAAGMMVPAAPVRDRIVLFDDVVTSGNHFVACRRLLLEHFAGREVVGVFAARRVVG